MDKQTKETTKELKAKKKQEQEEKELHDEEVLEELDIIEINADTISTEDGSEVYPWRLYIATEGDVITYSVYLYDDIREPMHYVKLFQIIRNLSTRCLLNIYINSPGGYLTTLVAFANILDETKAHVTMIVDGFADSAAAILAFVGDDVIIHDHASIMFHNIHSSGIFVQDGSRVKANIEAMLHIYKNLLIQYCSHVLTKQQIKNIIEQGSEYYFSGPELNKKLAQIS